MPRPAKDPNAPQKSDREKFVEAANKRTQTAIRALANVAKLPGKGRKPGDTDKLIRALRTQIDATEARLNAAPEAAPASILEV